MFFLTISFKSSTPKLCLIMKGTFEFLRRRKSNLLEFFIKKTNLPGYLYQKNKYFMKIHSINQ